MKILLANLPWINTEEFYGLRAGSRWPHLRNRKEMLEYYPFPFFLAYASAVLKEAGYEIILKDCIAEGITKKDFINFSSELKPDIAVFETSTPSIENDLELSKLVKETTNAVIVLTGPHVTAMPSEALKEEYIDYVLCGECDYVLRDLVSALKNNSDTSIIKGVCGKKNGKIFINERAPLINNLDDLPYPLRESLPMTKYNDPFCKHTPNTQMLTSRGCPYGCIFCMEPWVYYGKSNYRMRSPKSVVDEMAFLIKKYNAKEIYFDDSSFSVNQERVKKICDEITTRGIKVFWSCMADAKLEEDTLRQMKKNGCVAVKFGVESASPTILKNVNKPINLDNVKEVVNRCKKVGIETHATYMFGLPGETKETIKETTDFAFALKTDTAQFSVAIPYPGTKFYELAKENNWIIAKDWQDFSGSKSTIQYPNISPEEILNAANYCRKRIILKTVTNPRQAFQYLKSIYNYGGFYHLLHTIFQKLWYLIKH